jgi:hypothetical protein
MRVLIGRNETRVLILMLAAAVNSGTRTIKRPLDGFWRGLKICVKSYSGTAMPDGPKNKLGRALASYGSKTVGLMDIRDQ